MKRSACVHGHFYQPPRENPWTGAVERQPSAGRDHDWNARIARECYAPNGEARVLDGSGRLVDLVNNYAFMSFDFGPTLLSWLEQSDPRSYARVLAADRASVARLGHGAAIAQAYHHTILPLASPRDRLTEIRWGLADFKRRFGRASEGLWLPECAADEATLAAVAGEGVKFVLLEPHQAGGPVEPGVAYRWKGEGRELAVFFYDGALSRAVAFQRAMSDSRAFAARLSDAAVAERAALIATDGESYGHHDAFAEMGLAHLLTRDLAACGVEPTNLGRLLADFPPRAEVRLAAGATSWSCAHGVERWRSDCGCGAEGGRHQKWRAPLRGALDSLRLRLSAVYEEKAAGLLADPWAARDAYIEVVLDRSEESVARWLSVHAPAAKTPEQKVLVRTLLEMERAALMMFTSCGWFFDELSRLEPAQVLLYAARALELARAAGAPDLEPAFVADLAKAPSNEPSYGDGAGIWEKLVKPRVVGRDHAAARFAISALLGDAVPERVHGHVASCERPTRRVEGGVSVAAGRAAFRDAATGEAWSRAFIAALMPGQRVQAFVCAADIDDARLETLIAAAAGGHEAELPPGRLFRLRDLLPDEREQALHLALKRRLGRWEATARDLLEDALPLAEQYQGLGLPLPAGLAVQARLALGHALAAAAKHHAEGSFGAADAFRAVLERAAAAGQEIPLERVEAPWARAVAARLDALEKSFDEDELEALEATVALGMRAGLRGWFESAQVRAFGLFKGKTLSPRGKAVAAALALGL